MQKDRAKLIKQRDSLIKQINEAMPKAMADTTARYYNDDSTGIWLRGSEDYNEDGSRIFNYYDMEQMLHPTIQSIIDKVDWYAEPYDSGTCMLWH